MYTYRYTDENDKPLAKCPECQADLTKDRGITIELSVSGQSIDVPSRLDSNGVLHDTEDRAVASGFHSETQCGKCGESLVYHEETV